MSLFLFLFIKLTMTSSSQFMARGQSFLFWLIPERFQLQLFAALSGSLALTLMGQIVCPLYCALWEHLQRSLYIPGLSLRSWRVLLGAQRIFCPSFWAAAPKGTKSCRTQGESVRPYVRPSVPPPHPQGFVSFGAYSDPNSAK